MVRSQAVHGFGFDPEQSPYHFAVLIPRGETGVVQIEERFVWGADEAGEESGRQAALKVNLSGYRWSRIADQARVQFNGRLRAAGLRSAAWKAGETLLAPHFGKELILLAWAIEDADPTLIPNMIANWLGLAPEERWWLYTTINATSGHPEHGRDRGWRKAIKIAFAENPAAVSHEFAGGSESGAQTRVPRGRRTGRRSDAQLALPVEGRQLLMDDERT